MRIDDLEFVDVEDLDEMLDVEEAFFEEEEEEAALDEHAGMAEVLRDALHPDYADATDEEMQDALYAVFDELNPAESFNFAKALKQIEQGANQVFSDPTVSQIARTALPLAGKAVGTFFGGPLGAAVGGQLGTAVAGALPAPRQSGPPQRPAPAPTPAATMPAGYAPVTGGSAAAARGLMLTQQPDVLKALLALALGQQGRQEVGGVPIGQVASLVGSVFNKVAEDADQLLYATQSREADESGSTGEAGGGLYTQLIGAENAALQEAVGLP